MNEFKARGQNISFPGENSLLLPEPGKAFEVQVAEGPKTVPTWTSVLPPAPETLAWFDVGLGLGTWFNVMPDWRHVERVLSENPPSRRSLPVLLDR